MNTEVDYCAIDIGTDRCRVSVFVDGEPTVVPCDAEHSYIPSLLSYSSNSYYAGTQAIQQGGKNPLSNVYEVKTYIGTTLRPGSMDFKYSDYSYYIYSDKQGNPFYYPKTENGNRIVTIEETLVALMSTLRHRIDVFLKGVTIRRVLLTVPPYFSDSQRSALTRAASATGFEEVKMISEPLATYYGFLKVDMVIPEYMMVCNCGGGQFYSSLLHIVQEVPSVVNTVTNENANGSVITESIRSMLMKMEEVSKAVNRDSIKYCQLYNRIEKLKISLSEVLSTSLDLSVFGDSDEDDCEITRDMFSEAIKAVRSGVVQMCKDCIKSYLPNADHLPILLVGGCSHIPAIRQAIQTSFATSLFPVVDCADTVTVIGACSQAPKLLSVRKISLSSLTSTMVLDRSRTGGAPHPSITQSSPLTLSSSSQRVQKQPIPTVTIDARQKAFMTLQTHISSYLTFLQRYKGVESSVDWLKKAKSAVDATTYEQWTVANLEKYDNQIAQWFQSVKPK